MSSPKLFTGGASRFDVSQGILGDCWLVAAIASLTQDNILLRQVFCNLYSSLSLYHAMSRLYLKTSLLIGDM